LTIQQPAPGGNKDIRVGESRICGVIIPAPEGLHPRFPHRTHSADNGTDCTYPAYLPCCRSCRAAGPMHRTCIVPPGFGAVNQWEDGGCSEGSKKAGASAEAPARDAFGWESTIHSAIGCCRTACLHFPAPKQTDRMAMVSSKGMVETACLSHYKNKGWEPFGSQPRFL